MIPEFRGRFLLFLALSSVAVGAQEIHVTPAAALADEPVSIVLEAFPPETPVVLRAKTTDADETVWQAWAAFTTDRRGRVQVAQTAPAYGSYTGIDGMGLFWSMDVAGEGYSTRRFRTGAPAPVVLTAEVGGKVVATAEIVRRGSAEGVSRQDVRTAQVRGTLFTPATAPVGKVLVLGGSEGGIADEEVAALLASRGFTAMALAYFGLEELPRELASIPVERFFAAIDYLRATPGEPSVALLGTSKGAEAALLVASMRRDVSAVVAYAPSSVVWSCICGDAGQSSWSRNGAPVPFVPPGRDPRYAPPSGFPIEPAAHYVYRLRSAPPAATIPVERIAAPLLLIAGEDDRMWPSADMARRIAERRKSRRDRVMIFPRAGHLIGKTYAPAGSTRVGGGRIESGGDRAANARAQAESWPVVLDFLRRNLNAR